MTCTYPVNTTAAETEFRMAPELRMYGIVFCALLAVLATSGNLLVLLAIYGTTALHNVTNYFLASLAAADLSVGVIALPAWLSWFFLSTDQDLNSEAKALSVFVDIIYIQSFSASTYNLCAVTTDRYIAVRWPLRYHSLMTVKTFSTIVPFVWIFSILVSCVRVMIKGHSFWLITAVVAFVVPLVVIFYCYAYIWREARRQTRVVSERTAGEMSTRAHNRKSSVTVAIIIGVFLLCTLPMTVVTVTETVMEFLGLCELEDRFEKGSVWCLLVSFSNSAINPFIYAIRRKDFRNAFKRIVKRENSVHEQSSVQESRIGNWELWPTDVEWCNAAQCISRELTVEHVLQLERR